MGAKGSVENGKINAENWSQFEVGGIHRHSTAAFLLIILGVVFSRLQRYM